MNDEIDQEKSTLEVSPRELKLIAEMGAIRVKLCTAEAYNKSRILKIARRFSRQVRSRVHSSLIDQNILSLIAASKLFNETFYIHRYPEILDSGMTPIEHFVAFGAREHKDPSGLFDTEYYLSQVPNGSEIDNGLLHYLMHGAKLGLTPNRLKQQPLNPAPLFDTAYYVAQNPDVAQSGINPLEHYLLSGAQEGRNPNLFFDSNFYSSQRGLKLKPRYPLEDAEGAIDKFYAQAAYFHKNPTLSINPLVDYLEFGMHNGLQPHPLFDAEFYLKLGLENANSSDAYSDFLKLGIAKNRAPHALFDPQFYLENNPDVAQSGTDAITHFLKTGASEKRSPHPYFDTRYYLTQNADVKSAGINALIHFLESGATELRNPHPDFDIAYYTRTYGEKFGRQNALVHFVTSGKNTGCAPKFIELIEDVVLEDVDPDTLSFPKLDSVSVSVVIPSYKQNDFTRRCLKSLAEHSSRYAFEVVVVDDCSPDDTQQKLSGIAGLRYFRNEVNQGFVGTCNRGASESRGEFVVFLNNDTLVLDKWLDELIDTFYTHTEAGIVGSKLIYPDGALQDAGGIVYSDGDAANFGRDDDALKPEYNYVRSADYCTGAALAIRREQFLRLGGFGEDYRPIYWEDVDLAFKVRKDGMQCLYQPFSTAIHFEGVTCGRNTNTGLKQTQVINQKKFGATWSSELVNQPVHTDKPFIEWNRSSRKKVLFVTVLTPHADRDAGSTLTIEWLTTFKRLNYDVTFFPTSLKHDGVYTEHLQKQGIKCLYAPYVQSVEQYFDLLQDEYDLIVICRVEVFDKYLSTLKSHCPSAKYVFQTIDLHYLRTQREAELLNSEKLKLEADLLREQEFRCIQSADMTVVVSPHEVEVLKSVLDDPRVICVPFSTQLSKAATSFEQRRDIVFVGGYNHPPNVDAVKYLVSEVFPLLKNRLPGVKLYLIGGGVTDEVRNLACFDVIVTGLVDDLSTYLSFAKVSVAPMRFGAGLKGKILSSLGAGLPCVTTPIGIEGTGLTDGENVLLGENATELAEKIIMAYNDVETWTKLADNGFDFVASRFSPTVISSQIENLMTLIGVEQNV